MSGRTGATWRCPAPSLIVRPPARTETRPRRTRVTVPSQRSAVVHVALRPLAALLAPTVRNTPFSARMNSLRTVRRPRRVHTPAAS